MRKYVKPVSELISVRMSENIAQSEGYSYEGSYRVISDGNGNIKTTNMPFNDIIGMPNSELFPLLQKWLVENGITFTECWIQ